jgi:hypothetical protein
VRLVVDTNVFVSAALKYVSSPGSTVRGIPIVTPAAFVHAQAM